jgi:DEAD/DEAH box helicase domain-containing protein
LDTYFAEHPDELFERTNEPLVLNLQNRRLVCHHLACSIQETGDENSVNGDILGPHIEHALELRRSGHLSAEVFYSDDPHMRTPIRCADIQNYKLMLGDQEVGEIDSWHLIREAYPHAIYLHAGRRYRVTDIFKSTKEIRLKKEHSCNVTDPLISKAVNTRRVRAITKYPQILVKKADFDVTERLVQIFERNHAGEIIGQYQGGQGLAPHRLPTEGISIELLPQLCMRIDEEINVGNRASVVHAIERLICGLFPVISGPCDTMDFDTFSEVHPGRICWYLYDSVHDGIDLAVRAYPRVAELLAKALDRLQSCTCSDEKGCFRCIRNPDEEQPVSKSDCIRILDLLCAELQTGSTQEEFDADLLENESTSQECPACGKTAGDAAKFCGNCGQALGDVV